MFTDNNNCQENRVLTFNWTDYRERSSIAFDWTVEDILSKTPCSQQELIDHMNAKVPSLGHELVVVLVNMRMGNDPSLHSYFAQEDGVLQLHPRRAFGQPMN